MWSQFKKLAACNLQLATLLLLVACGFQPMYGEHSALSANSPLAGNLVIDGIPGHEGQILRIALENKFNPEGVKHAAPQYRLHVQLVRALIPAVVKGDGTIQRYDVQVTSTFVLTDIATNKILLNGDVHRIGSYNVAVNANFATYEAQQNVVERTLNEIAEDYVLRISGHFAGKK